MEIVGRYICRFNEILDINLPISEIYQSHGLIRHINKRHPGYEVYLPIIPEIINAPDYIGVNIKEKNSIELVKTVDKNIQIAIKLDNKNGYLYVASLYEISDMKLSNRLNSGRLKLYNTIDTYKQDNLISDG